MSENNYALELETIQVKEFKTLIEALKDILTEANIMFDHQGMRVSAMEMEQTVLVHLRLYADKFERYHCKEPINVGVEMQELYKIIKVLGNNETLTIYIKERDDDKIWFKIFNADTGKVMKINLGRMDLNYNELEIPKMEFDSIITMPSSEFQKTCRYYNNFSDMIEIRCVDDNITLSCVGETGRVGISASYSKTGEEQALNIANGKPSEIVQGYYNLKYLVSFSKCTDLCDSIKMMMNNNFPLVISFQVGSLGELKMCIAPVVMDD